MVGVYLHDRYHDDVRRGVGDMSAWLKMREAQIARGALNEFQTYTRPSQGRGRF